MTEAQLMKFIRQVIREELAPILMGSVVSNQDQNRSTVQRFNSEGPIQNLRNVQPFGVSSRAPAKTPALIIPINGDPSHLNMVGHFDESRPTGADGETLLYDAFGHIIFMSETKIQVGSKTSAENMVLGKVFKNDFADPLMTQLQAETHTSGVPGFPTSPPINAPQYAAIQASPIDDNAILSDKVFTEK